MDDAALVAIAFLVCFLLGLVVMLILSPYWYQFASSVMPQRANRVTGIEQLKDDTESGDRSPRSGNKASSTVRLTQSLIFGALFI